MLEGYIEKVFDPCHLFKVFARVFIHIIQQVMFSESYGFYVCGQFAVEKF